MTDSSDSDYIEETISNSSEDEGEVPETTQIKIIQDEQIRKLLELGELRIENIIELQMLIAFIKEQDISDDKKLSMGKCLEMLINCTNAYLSQLKENF